MVFNYHAFDRELVDRIVRRLDEEVVASGRKVFFIYENPVHSDALDSMRGFSADDDDNVVVWRRGGPPRQAHQGAGTSIVMTKSGLRAEVAARS